MDRAHLLQHLAEAERHGSDGAEQIAESRWFEPCRRRQLA